MLFSVFSVFSVVQPFDLLAAGIKRRVRRSGL